MTSNTPDEMMATYEAALLKGDWQTCSDLYEDGAVYYRPNRVLARDRPAIEAFYRQAAEGSELISLRRVEGRLTISGDYAFQHGFYIMESRDRSSGEANTFESRSTLVLHRGPDGWRFQVMQGS